MKLRSRRAFLGTRQGGHASLKRGHGMEFSDYRNYEPGDDPRHIDWSVYARSERLYLKLFQEEQDLSVMIILDSSASMVTPATDGKWERARDIALSLAYIALIQQDRVSVSVPGYLHTPFFSGAGGIHNLSGMLQKLSISGVVDFERGVQQAISRIRFPGVAVFISDFLMPFEELERLFNLLRAKNLDISAIQVLGPNDLNPLEGEEQVVAIDSENGDQVQLQLTPEVREDYSYLLQEHNQHLCEFLHQSRISYLLAHSQEELGAFVVDKLSTMALLK
ncbi:MAG: DUF58 domain-containing protein [Deltaproteobacteria bacterium]|nr:DUF58 domain-containing protein [Deltaproteobacteria bacterium]